MLPARMANGDNQSYGSLYPMNSCHYHGLQPRKGRGGKVTVAIVRYTDYSSISDNYQAVLCVSCCTRIWTELIVCFVIHHNREIV